MGLKCGLDEQFLTAFTTKMATKSPMKRRGMLLLMKLLISSPVFAPELQEPEVTGECSDASHQEGADVGVLLC